MTLNRNKRISNSEQPKIFFWSVVLFIFLGLFSYGYLVRSAIVNIVSRQTIERDILALSSQVLSLESEYVKAKNNVTLDSAKSLGFAVSSQKFVTKTDNTSGLSVNIR